MNIDKQLLKVLQSSAWTKIPYELLLETSPEQIRIEENNLMKQEGALETPDAIQVFNKEIQSTDKKSLISLRIYKPKQIVNNLPMILFFHGGAFIFGSGDQYDFQMYPLVQETNVIIVSVDYRLAPKYPFPAALEDSVNALQYIYENAEAFGGNRNNISVMGSSAGGTIALSLLHLNRDHDNIPITSGFFLYPPTCDELNTSSMQVYANAPMQSKKSARYMWKYYLSGNSTKWMEYAVPNKMCNYKGLPPMVFVLAEYDPLIDEAKEYIKAIIANNGNVKVKQVQGAVHTFDFFECRLTDDFTKYKVEYFKKLHSL
ncbi:alpha/beta hydrolase [Myroides sp. M-43]|uniref:alpha/beta hydrolase n=1 Tax=Myroides oncorhynchi TaxID=2893756 RepID=UPI001E2D19C9|nr:alpha/beta hydrolase [Myroides oncorhynchi]MCC9043243.1 alpha/beta hydrolase [Myroides oncorhynchi]